MTGPTSKPPSWSKDAAKYLLPEEGLVVATRRHPAVLIKPFAKALPVAAVVVWLLSVAGSVAAVRVLCLVVLGAVVVYLLLHVGEWWIRHFLITRRRVMLISGIIVRTVAVMPLRRITDMTWQETPLGQVLGYGTFRFESAGQDQALSTVEYLPHAGQLYLAVTDLLFGQDYGGANGGAEEEEGSGSPRASGSPAPPGSPARPAPPEASPPLQQRPPAQQRPPVQQRQPPSRTPTERQDTEPIPRLPPTRW